MKTNKLLYGALALAPLILIVVMFVFMGMMFSAVFSDLGASRYRSEMDMPYYLEMMIVAMVTGVVSLVGMVTYIMHCLNNIHIVQDKRTMWVVILVLAGTIGMVIYFFTWIAKEDQLNAKNPVSF